jgi:hypothetical protein
MTDAEFFRRIVAERAESLDTIVSSFSQRILEIHVEELSRLTTDAERTEHLVRIAALCERAAVDITIPNSRLAQKRKPNRVHRVNPVQKGKSK